MIHQVGQVELPTLLFFTSVQNPLETKKYVEQCGNGSVAVSTSYVLNSMHLKVSVHKSLLNKLQSRMKAKSISSEILYQLSPSCKINAAVKQFEATSSSTDIAIILINQTEEIAIQMKNVVVGNEIDQNTFDTIIAESKISSICKFFNISAEELLISSVSNALMMKIALKDIL